MKYVLTVSVLMISWLEVKALAQSSSPECMGASLGTLIGVLINPRANTSSAIPDHCKGDVNANPQRPALSQEEINTTTREGTRKLHRDLELQRFERSRWKPYYNGY